MGSPRPVVFDGSQVGIQSAINVLAAANKKLASPSFGPIIESAEGGYIHFNVGSRMGTATVPPGYFETTSAYQGPLDYVCALYPFATYFGIPTPTPDGTNGWAWDFFLALNAGNTRTFFTLERGSASRAARAINMYGNSLTLNISKLTQSYSGDMKGGKKERGVTLTGSPDEVAAIVIPPQNFNLYYGATKAALDTAVSTDDKLLAPFGISTVWTFPEVAERLARMNSTERSFAAVNDKSLQPTLAIKFTDQTEYDAFEDIIDTGDKAFFAVQALGSTIAPDSQFEFRADFCGTLIAPSTEEQEKSAVANMITFQGVHDETWGQGHNIHIVTNIQDINA